MGASEASPLSMRVVAGKGVEGLAASAQRRGPTGGRRPAINPPAQSEDLNLAVPLSIFILFHSHLFLWEERSIDSSDGVGDSHKSIGMTLLAPVPSA